MSKHKRFEGETNDAFILYSHTCEECGKPTAERKPYCLDHIWRMPYVGVIVEELRARAAEVDAILSGSEASATSSRGLEILTMVRERGSLTIGRLSVEVLMPNKAVMAFAVALEKAGLVSITTISCKSHRSYIVVAR